MTQFNAKEHKIIRTHYKVVKVVDGDGLIVEDIFSKTQIEIRLLGIDAPEIRRCRKLEQDERETHISGGLLMHLGRLSFNFMKELIPPLTNITIVQEIEELRDPYKRLLAYVFLPDGRCLNEIMVAEGFAKPFNRFFCSELLKYQLLNNTAKIEQKGLYAISDF